MDEYTLTQNEVEKEIVVGVEFSQESVKAFLDRPFYRDCAFKSVKKTTYVDGKAVRHAICVTYYGEVTGAINAAKQIIEDLS